MDPHHGPPPQHPPLPPHSRAPQAGHPDLEIFPFLTDAFIDSLTATQAQQWVALVIPAAVASTIRKNCRVAERRTHLKFLRDLKRDGTVNSDVDCFATCHFVYKNGAMLHLRVSQVLPKVEASFFVHLLPKESGRVRIASTCGGKSRGLNFAPSVIYFPSETVMQIHKSADRQNHKICHIFRR